MERCRQIDSAVTVTCWTDPTRFCWNRLANTVQTCRTGSPTRLLD